MMLTQTFLVCMIILFISTASASDIEDVWLDGRGYNWCKLFLADLPLKTGHYPNKRPVNDLNGYHVKVFIHTPHGDIKKACFIEKNGALSLSFPTPTKGVYIAFFVAERVIDKIREIHISKQEINGDQFWYGKSWAGLDRKTLTIPRLTREVPFDLIRERIRRMEIANTNIWPTGEGDFTTFRAYFRGNPQEGAPVTLTTREGWSKTAITDADGQASLQLIRDDYKRKFSRLTRSEVMVKTSLLTSKEGETADGPYTQTHYRMIWPMESTPSYLEWSSRINALYLFLLILSMVGGGIFLYRFLTLK